MQHRSSRKMLVEKKVQVERISAFTIHANVVQDTNTQSSLSLNMLNLFKRLSLQLPESWNFVLI